MVQGLIDHVPSLGPDLHFRLLKNPQAAQPLSTASNVTETIVRAGANSPASMWFLPELTPLSGSDMFHGMANILPARLPMPSVTTVHDIMWLTNPDWCDASAYGQVKRRFYGHGVRRALAKSDQIAVVSEATREAILAHDSSCADRLTVTRSGVSQRFKPTDHARQVRSRLGLPETAQFALIVGQCAPYKNHEGAIAAFARAFAGQREKVLVIVQRQGVQRQGAQRRGAQGHALEELARKLGVADQIRFTGPVDEGLLLQLYSAAKFLLHPSFCEGFGNPIAEAMACGCPVITSNRSAMPEVAGGAAMLVDPTCESSIAGAMTDLWHDDSLAGTMQCAGIKRASELRWADFARANIAIYRRVLADN